MSAKSNEIKDPRDIFDHKDINKFIDSIVVLYNFGGISGSLFAVCQAGGTKFLTKMCFYIKEAYATSGESTSGVSSVMSEPADTEIKILAFIKNKIIDKNHSPCFIEMLYHKTFDDFLASIPGDLGCDKLGRGIRSNDELVNKVKDIICYRTALVRNGFALNKCSFIVLEQCAGTVADMIAGMAKDHMVLAFEVLRSFVFMVIHALWVMRKFDPKARHFDLHTQNVLVKFTASYDLDLSRTSYLKFPVKKGVDFYIPFMGALPKIIDFGFSTLPDNNIISNKVKDKFFTYHRAENDALLWFSGLNGRLSSTRIGNRAYELFCALDPTKFFEYHYTDIINQHSDEVPSYEQMLMSGVFDSYKDVTRAKTDSVIHEYAPVD